MNSKRQEELKRFRTTTKDGHPTFDLEAYYDSLSTPELEERLRFTVESLARYPNFGTRFYLEFADYLRSKISKRKEV